MTVRSSRGGGGCVFKTLLVQAVEQNNVRIWHNPNPNSDLKYRSESLCVTFYAEIVSTRI